MVFLSSKILTITSVGEQIDMTSIFLCERLPLVYFHSFNLHLKKIGLIYIWFLGTIEVSRHDFGDF